MGREGDGLDRFGVQKGFRHRSDQATGRDPADQRGSRESEDRAFELAGIRNQSAVHHGGRERSETHSEEANPLETRAADRRFNSADHSAGQSLFERFKEILNIILKSLGLDYSENSVTAQAINSTFELITDKNVKSEVSSKYQEQSDIAFGSFENSVNEDDQKLLDKLHNELGYMDWSTNPEDSLSIAELPAIPNINENNCY